MYPRVPKTVIWPSAMHNRAPRRSRLALWVARGFFALLALAMWLALTYSVGYQHGAEHACQEIQRRVRERMAERKSEQLRALRPRTLPESSPELQNLLRSVEDWK